MGADELLPFSSLGFPSLPAAEWVLELPVLTSAPSSGSHAGANRTLAPGGAFGLMPPWLPDSHLQAPWGQRREQTTSGPDGGCSHRKGNPNHAACAMRFIQICDSGTLSPDRGAVVGCRVL